MASTHPSYLFILVCLGIITSFFHLAGVSSKESSPYQTETLFSYVPESARTELGRGDGTLDLKLVTTIEFFTHNLYRQSLNRTNVESRTSKASSKSPFTVEFRTGSLPLWSIFGSLPPYNIWVTSHNSVLCRSQADDNTKELENREIERESGWNCEATDFHFHNLVSFENAQVHCEVQLSYDSFDLDSCHLVSDSTVSQPLFCFFQMILAEIFVYLYFMLGLRKYFRLSWTLFSAFFCNLTRFAFLNFLKNIEDPVTVKVLSYFMLFGSPLFLIVSYRIYSLCISSKEESLKKQEGVHEGVASSN